MRRAITRLSLCLLCMTSVAEPGSEKGVSLGGGAFIPSRAQPVGRRGDGSNVFPGANPPVVWDGLSGTNILWSTSLPSWGQSGVIVASNRCFLTTEPHILVCIDAKSGNVLWQRDNDHLDLWPAVEASKTREEWREEVRKTEEAWLAGFELNYLRGGELVRFWANNYASRVGNGTDAPRNESVVALIDGLWKGTSVVTNRIAELEATFTECGWNSRIDYFHPPQGNPFRMSTEAFAVSNRIRTNLLTKYGFDFEYHWGYIGQAFATPVTDGSHVYVTFGYGQIVCYDFDGSRKWMKWYPPDNERLTYDRDDLVSLPSPVLAGDILIVHTGSCIRGLDKATGEQIWHHPYKNWFYATGGGTPALMTLGGTTIVVSSHGRAYRASDGAILLDGGKFHDENGKILFKGLPQSVGSSTVQGNRVFFVDRDRSREPYQAKSFAFDASGMLTVTDDWVYKIEANSPLWHGPTVYDGLVHIHTTSQRDSKNALLILDAKDGRVLGNLGFGVHANTVYGGAYGPDVAIAGDFLFLHTGRGATAVYTLGREPRLLHVNRLYSQVHRDVAERKLSYAELRRKWFNRGIYPWDIWTASSPYFHGDRVYIRTHEALVCIGRMKTDDIEKGRRVGP